MFKIRNLIWIAILFGGWNFLFDNDDEDTKNVEVNKNNGKSIVQEIKDAAKEVKAEVKDIYKIAKAEFNNDVCIEVTCYDLYGASAGLPEPFIVTGSIDNPTSIKTFEESDKQYSSYSPRGGNWLELKSKYDLDPDDDWESCACTNFVSRKEKPIIVVEDTKNEKISSNAPKKDTLPKLEYINKEPKNKKPMFRSID